MPGFPRPPSFVSVHQSQSELGSFQKFLEQPKPKRTKTLNRREMSGRGNWRRLAWQAVEVFFAETVGTAMLLFFGCMGTIAWTPEPLNPLQSPVVFSVVVATIIQIFGHISAAHLNPAVTIAFMILGQVTPGMALVYVCSECLGAVLGYGLLILLTPAAVMRLHMEHSAGHCCTTPRPDLTDVQSVAMEFFATSFLVMMVCACSDSRNSDKADSTPLKFACTILALSVAVGPYTGASMNPARTLGPALWNNRWSSHWIYWLGPCLSGLFTAIFYQAIFNRHQVQDATFTKDAPLHQVKDAASFVEEVPLHQVIQRNSRMENTR